MKNSSPPSISPGQYLRHDEKIKSFSISAILIRVRSAILLFRHFTPQGRFPKVDLGRLSKGSERAISDISYL
jgi:hypothetical protein